LAFHNYNDVYNAWPRSGFDAVNSTYPGGIMMVNYQGWGPALLPYLDQAPTYAKYNSSIPWYSPNNQTAIKTYVPAFKCPSSPGENVVTITFNKLTAGNLGIWKKIMRNSSVQVTPDAGFAAAGITPLTQNYTFTAGTNDYSCIAKEQFSSALEGGQASITPNASISIDRNATALVENLDLDEVGANYGSTNDQKVGLKWVVDGPSNTLLLVEAAARDQFWVRSSDPNGRYGFGLVVKNTTNTPDATLGFKSAQDWAVNYSGGTWADGQNFLWLSGSDFSGASTSGSAKQCIVNCANARTWGCDDSTHTETGANGIPVNDCPAGGGSNDSRGMFSFHTNGVTVLLCDGSARFLNDNTNRATIYCLISRGRADSPIGDW
ncbi:MAG: DUF1559 domain-containing protein, partial [Planctomycetales bacterium]